jgi:hypothetical protein
MPAPEALLRKAAAGRDHLEGFALAAMFRPATKPRGA